MHLGAADGVEVDEVRAVGSQLLQALVGVVYDLAPAQPQLPDSLAAASQLHDPRVRDCRALVQRDTLELPAAGGEDAEVQVRQLGAASEVNLAKAAAAKGEGAQPDFAERGDVAQVEHAQALAPLAQRPEAHVRDVSAVGEA